LRENTASQAGGGDQAVDALQVWEAVSALHSVHGLSPSAEISVVDHVMDALQANSSRRQAQRPQHDHQD